MNEQAQTQATESQVSQTQEAETSQPTQQAGESDKDFSKRFASFIKKEQKYQSEIEQLKAKLKELEPLAELKSKAKQDPISYMNAASLTLDDFLTAGEAKKEPTLEDRLQQIESLIDTERKTREQRQMEEAIGTFKNQIKDHVTGNTEKYELLHLQDAIDAVYDTIELYWQKTKEQMPIEKACELVEQELQAELEAKKPLLEKSSKFKKIFSPVLETTDKPQTQAPKRDVTLNNHFTAQTSAVEEKRPMSREESLKRAAQMLKWT